MFTVCNGWQYTLTITINHLFTFAIYTSLKSFLFVFIIIINARASARALESAQ